MYLCIVVMLVTILFSALSQRKVRVSNGTDGSREHSYSVSFNLPLYILSFVVLASFCFFTKSGQDMEAYAIYYRQWSIKGLSDFTFEPLFKLTCILLRVFIKNPYIGLGVIKIFSLFLVYRAIYLMRDKLNVSLAIFAYLALGLYFFNFHLLRIMMAVAIVYLGLVYEILGKQKKCLTLLILAFFIHYTSIVIIVTYVVYRTLGSKMTLRKLSVILAVLMLIYSAAAKLVDILVSNIPYFEKYNIYMYSNQSGSGMLQMVLFIPVIYILISRNKKEKSEAFYKLSAMIGLVLFFCGCLGYVFQVIGRSLYFCYFFPIFYGASLTMKNDFIYIKFGKKRISMLNVALALYLLLNIFVNFVALDMLNDKTFSQHMFIWE